MTNDKSESAFSLPNVALFIVSAKLRTCFAMSEALGTAWAATIALAERPAPFSARDGSILRLVPANELISSHEAPQQFAALWRQRPHLVPVFDRLLALPTARKHAAAAPPRHVAAWARGWLYLQAGNTRQALRDARTAMAYAPAATTGSGPGGTTSATDGDGQSAAVGAVRPPDCAWVPALFLAGECFTAVADWPRAVLHLAQALQQLRGAKGAADDINTAAEEAAASALLASAVRQLPPDQALAWATAGMPGLCQRLQEEAEMRLPEVLRPRPKWYYFNKWMGQRIHTALLELHLTSAAAAAAAAVPPALPGRSGSGSGLKLPPVGDAQQLLSVAEAWNGGESQALLAAAAAAAGFQVDPSSSSDGGKMVWASAEGRQAAAGRGELPFQLAAPVLSKLLSMDAGDLDLIIQHPAALQAQVYELLDVFEVGGAQALEHHAIPPLSWQEMQTLLGPESVGLPLGYQAPPLAEQRLPPAAATSVVQQLETAMAEDQRLQGTSTAAGSDGCIVAAELGDFAVANDDGGMSVAAVAPTAPLCEQGWRRRGWTRADYLLSS